MSRPSGLGQRRKMESPPTLDLGTINIASFVEGLIYYQSTCSDFRYKDEKVLGTQSCLSRGSTFTHYVLRLNLIKDTFNIYHSRLTHTHISIHLSIQHGIFISNPKIHLSCISSHLKPQHTSITHGIISYSRQKHRHGSNHTTCYRNLNIKNTSFNQACSYSSTKAYSKQMHAHMNA